MSNNYMFPPSSPLIGERDDDIKPKAMSGSGFAGFADANSTFASTNVRSDRGRTEYPTPNPSSSVFRLSSPVNDSKVTINRDFNILLPDSSVLRVPLIPHQSNLTIGRSSKSCDFFFGTKDKLISREHISITYDSSNIVLTCLGVNGLAVTIPRACYVYATNSKNNYIIRQSQAPLSIDSPLKKCYKSIKLADSYTGFTVNRNETITLPRFTNILVEVNKHIILINPADDEEDLTDDELPVLATSFTPVKPLNEEFAPSTPLKSIPSALNVASINQDTTPSKSGSTSTDKQQVTSEKKIDVKLQKPKSKKPFEIYQDTTAKSQSIPNSPVKLGKQSMHLQDKTNSSNITKRKAQSEEPPKLKKKQKHEETTVKEAEDKIEDTSVISSMNPDVVLKDVADISEVSNILINHLAFSRLSSTPASFLNTISAVTSKLSLKQIRVLLHNIECIGIIHRQGKDAAGKALQEEYYYLPEKDNDEQRTTLVAQIKGHGGLRACRRTHKQYYWKKPAPIKK